MTAEYERYSLKYDLHTHTTFSHGKGSIEDNVKEAIKKGLSAIAISDHGPGHLTYGIKRESVPVMRAEIERLKKLYPQIEIFLSVEANVIDCGNYLDVAKDEFSQYDFVIAGYHYGVRHGYCVQNYLFDHTRGRKDRGKSENGAVYAIKGGASEAEGKQTCGTDAGSLLVKNTEMTLKAIYENDLKILTHPGDKGPFDIAEIARACAERGTLMEINNRHGHMTAAELKAIEHFDVKFIISSDAHRPCDVGCCGEAVKRLLAAGIDPERVVNLVRKD